MSDTKSKTPRTANPKGLKNNSDTSNSTANSRPHLQDATEALVDAIASTGRKVKSTGSDRWIAQCPAHEDGRPSLSISRGRGRALAFCFAGCTPDAVAEAVGLRIDALFDDPKGIEYKYGDGRTVNRTPGKRFYQKVPDGTSVMLYVPPGVDLASAVAGGATIYIPEGEQDADTLALNKAIAVSAPMGAANWSKADYSPLKGAARLVIIADKDEPGYVRAAGLLEHLQGIAKSVEIVTAKYGKDATDHLAAGAPLEELVAFTAPKSRAQRGRELLATSLASVAPKRQQWAYQDLVPLGVPTILAGRGGIGKSTILSWLAAGLTRGTFAGDLMGTPASVGFISGEDDLATTLVPRLTAAGADLSLVWDFSAVRTTAEDGSEWTGLPTIADDLAALKKQLRDHEVRVLIIDPVLSLMSGDSIKASDVRRNLDPIAGLAAELGIAPILVMHFGKGQGNASDKVSGSHAFRDIARSVLLLAVDEDTDQRILTVDKSNYSTHSASLAFEVVSASVETGDGDLAVVGRAALIGETTLTVHELVRRSEDASLGDLSSEILAFVTSADREIETSDVVEEFDIQANQARVYLGRLARSERIQRTGRGKYVRNTENRPVAPVASVASVAFNHPNATHITDATPQQVPCHTCGEPLHPALRTAGISVHPNCEAAA